MVATVGKLYRLKTPEARRGPIEIVFPETGEVVWPLFTRSFDIDPWCLLKTTPLLLFKREELLPCAGASGMPSPSKKRTEYSFLFQETVVTTILGSDVKKEFADYFCEAT